MQKRCSLAADLFQYFRSRPADARSVSPWWLAGVLWLGLMLLAFGPARAGTVDITALERSSVRLTPRVDVLIDPAGELGAD